MVSELLDIQAIRQRVYSLTVAQYHLLGENGLYGESVELLEGVIVEKMSKSPLHTFLVVSLARLLENAIGSGCHLRIEQPITCYHSEPEPDLAVVRGRPQDYLREHPYTADLVIEIAVSSAEIDRKKTAIYAAAKVSEYWIVVPETRQIEVHACLVDGRYSAQRICSVEETVISERFPNFRVNLSGLYPSD